MRERKKWNEEKSEKLECIGCGKSFDSSLLEKRCKVTIGGCNHTFIPETWDICPECRKSKPIPKEDVDERK